MTPDEVINKLNLLEVDISRTTLMRYENQMLIPPAERGAYGRGGGRWTEYPVETVFEAYAAWCLLHGNYITTHYGSVKLDDFTELKAAKIPPKTVTIVRKYAKQYGGGLIKQLERLLYNMKWGSEDGTNDDYAYIGKKCSELFIQHQFNSSIPETTDHMLPEDLKAFIEFLADIWMQKYEEAKELLKTL